MILPLTLAAAFAGPDPAPAMAAVRACDAQAMQAVTLAEPRRRSEWAAALYAEQQAVVRERAAILARAEAPASPADLAALAALDARQRQLDSARNVETSWRALVEELRYDYLANCGTSKGGKIR